jgi:hypothetical protein
MGKRGLRTGAPDEYKDVYFREVIIELDRAEGLLLNLEVRAQIQAG